MYYQCKILCPEEIDGLVGALEMLKFNPGRDFDVVLVSIDATETPAIAAREKAFYMKRYGRPQDVNGWHFLTGQEPAIRALASAVGFGYVPMQGPDGKMTQFAHASAIELVTPEGRLAQYYLGVEFSPKDLQLGLVEASHGTIGSLVDNLLTYCYQYDPTMNRHTLVVCADFPGGWSADGSVSGDISCSELSARHTGSASTENTIGERIKGDDAFHQSGTLAIFN